MSITLNLPEVEKIYSKQQIQAIVSAYLLELVRQNNLIKRNMGKNYTEFIEVEEANLTPEEKFELEEYKKWKLTFVNL